MQDKLRAAFSKKEKTEMFLANLEKLKEEKNVGDVQYGVLKIEYTQMRDDAISEINTVKNTIKRELDSKASRLEVLKQELGYLETRFKVGQLSSDTYLAKEKAPKRQATELEKRIAELQTFLNASGSPELGITTESGIKILGFNLGSAKKQSSDEMVTSTTNAPAISQVTSPESSETPPAPSVPSAAPPPPPPPPPSIEISGLQIMPDRVREGSSVGIIVTVTNITIGNLQQKVSLKINDEVKDSREVHLFPGESQEVTFVTSAGKPGNYQADINGVTGVFTVVAVDTARDLQ